MPSPENPYPYSRRSFLGLGLAAMSGLLVPGCVASRPGMSSLQNLPSSFLPVVSDHPLTQLHFKNLGVIPSSMHIGPVESNVLYSEGIHSWHQKGKRPYAYELPVDPRSPDFDPALIPASRLRPPPLGIRSAPALGGLGTGTITMQSDGTLVDWQIFNNSPGDGSPKVHILDAFWGIRTEVNGRSAAKVMRTYAPGDLPAVSSIAGSGGFPATVLQLSDPDLPLASRLYAYGVLDLHDPDLSAVPAVIFSVVLSNPTTAPVSTSLMFAMPNIIEGTFRTENGLTLSRRGDTPMAGEISMAFSSGNPSYSMISPDLAEIWDTFDQSGRFQEASGLGIFEHGAISTQFVIEPGASRTTNFILSWYFPNRIIGSEQVGNFYTTQYTSARQVKLNTERHLPQIWRSMLNWQTLCLENSLPTPIQDALLNSLSLLYKTTFSTEDERWRHWDSFANPKISSLDHQAYRVFPLLFFAPDVLKSQLRAFATQQHTSGRILQSLGMGERHPLDDAEGALSTTQTPIFFLLVYLYYNYTGDRNFIQDIWPHLSKAIDWQLSITTPGGLPSNLPMLGDWEALDTEGIQLADVLFQVGGLTAAMHLARTLDQADTVTLLQPVVIEAQKAINDQFWQENRFSAHLTQDESEATSPSDDALLGFLLPMLTGMQTVQPERISSHLAQIDIANLSLFPARLMLWSALHMLTAESPRVGLETVSKLLVQQRDGLRDFWGYYEQLTEEGQPWANPNYAGHLSIWFVLLALSGQRFDAESGTLHFNPGTAANTTLPFFTPAAHGLLSIRKGNMYTIQVISGRLTLNELLIGSSIRHRDIALEEGQALQLEA